jgi:dihydrofolate reductase
VRTLTYYVGTSLDGFIAAPDGSYDFYPVDEELVQWFVAEYPEVLPTHVRAALGVTGEGRRFDTVVMGRGTYAPALKAGITSPYAHLRQLVVSRSLERSPDPAVELVREAPLERVRALKREEGKGIYLAGGGELAGALLPEVDTLVLKLYPVVAGAGIPLFRAGFSPTHFSLVDSRTFRSGMVALTYARR